MDKSMMTVEQILRDGGTVDEILDMVRVEASRILAKMKEEEEAKKKGETEFKVARQELIAAFINYLIARGDTTEAEVAEVGPEMFEKALEEAETLLPQRKHIQDEVIKRIEKVLKDNSMVTRLGQETPVKVTIKKDQDADDWFHEFVKSL